MEATLQHPWLWGRTRELPLDDQTTARTSHNGFFMQLNKPTKHQVLMLEVGFFWICCGKGGCPILSGERMNARARYRPACSGLSPFLWELACSFLPWCSKTMLKSKREMENHMKATLILCVMCSCQRHKPEVSLLAGDPPPLHSWAERHFTEHNFSKLRALVTG